jgi:hypothetical protein
MPNGMKELPIRKKRPHQKQPGALDHRALEQQRGQQNQKIKDK